jgi:hypothetical protein
MPEQLDVVGKIIETVFDNMEEQFALSHRSAAEQVFVSAPQTVPPPRESGFVFNSHALGGHAIARTGE